jgi:hypothetical protein
MSGQIKHTLSNLHFILSAIVFLFIFTNSSFALKTGADSSKVILKDNNFTPLQILKGDTIKIDTVKTKLDAMPGAFGRPTSMFQDSNYTRALRLRIPLSTRLNNDLRMFSQYLPTVAKKPYSPYERIRENLDIPPEYFKPSAREMFQHEYNLQQASTYNNTTLYNPNGLKIPFSMIGSFLGLVEDVSPVMKYTLEYRTRVQVVVYSMNAVIIATMFDGIQSPGDFTYTWNGRDDSGRLLPVGDYVGEVRIGKEKLIRKRIYLSR